MSPLAMSRRGIIRAVVDDTKPKALRRLNALIAKAEHEKTQAIREKDDQAITRLVKRIAGLEARRKAVESKGVDFLIEQSKLQNKHGKKGGRKPYSETAEKVREIMRKRGCTRQWAYRLLKKKDEPPS